jgi:hypothetical protein
MAQRELSPISMKPNQSLAIILTGFAGQTRRHKDVSLRSYYPRSRRQKFGVAAGRQTHDIGYLIDFSASIAEIDKPEVL